MALEQTEELDLDGVDLLESGDGFVLEGRDRYLTHQLVRLVEHVLD